MAFELRHWVGALLAGTAFLAIRGAPALEHRLPRTERRALEPAVERFLELRRQVSVGEGVIERLAWLDSTAAIIASARVDEAPVALALAPGFPPEAVADFQGRLREEVAAEGRRAPAMDVGVVVRLEEAGPRSPRDEYYVGDDGGRPFCLVRRSVRDALPSNLTPDGSAVALEPSAPEPVRTRLLGPCAFFLRYGGPGPAIRDWLWGGAILRTGQERVPARHLLEDRRSAVLGRWDHPLELSPRGRRCLEGSRDACTALFLTGTSQQTPFTAASRAWLFELWAEDLIRYGGRDFPYADAALFADLERQFGQERFARFWTSDTEPVAAFSAAFGVHPGDWVGDWARSYYGEGRRALRAGMWSWAVTLLLIGAALSLAVLTARRRQAG